MVRLHGELDLESIHLLRGTLRQLRTEKADVLVDLSKLEFIDSSGLQLLWNAAVQSGEEGRELKLTAGQPQVMRVFELTGLGRRLPFVDAP